MAGFTPITSMLRPAFADPIRVDQLKQRNALADREMATREQNALAYEQNALANQGNRAAQIRKDQAEYAYRVASELAAIQDPAQFAAVADQIANDPTFRSIPTAWSREQITPDSVRDALPKLRAAAGVDMPQPAVPFEQSDTAKEIQMRAAEARKLQGQNAASDLALERLRQAGRPAPAADAPAPAQDPAIVDAKLTGASNTLSAIDDALKQVGYLTAGFGGQIASKVGATPAIDLESNLDTIKANVGFDRLQMMREASKTGGALGQVAVQELQMLQAVVASLNKNQSPAQLRRNLEKVRAQYTKAVAAYEAMGTGVAGRNGMTIFPGSNRGPAVGTVDGGYRFKGGDPANQSNWEKVK